MAQVKYAVFGGPTTGDEPMLNGDVNFFQTEAEATAYAEMLIAKAKREMREAEGHYPSWIDDVAVLRMISEPRMQRDGHYALKTIG